MKLHTPLLTHVQTFVSYHARMMDDIVEKAHRHLRGHSCAEIRFEEHIRHLSYVFHQDGYLVAPVMVAMLQALETMIFVPEATENALEALVTLDELDERGSEGAITDRWRIYHGDPQDVRWARMNIDAGKLEGSVIDGTVLMRANPFAVDESRICKHMNQDHSADLRILALHFAHIEIENPVMIGIDPLGIDIRGRFDVVRINAAEEMQDAEDARAVLKSMVETVKDLPHPADLTSSDESDG